MTVSLCIRQGSKRNDDSVSVEELDWSAESQILIPAEHLWCDFKCRPWAKNSSPNTNDLYIWVQSFHTLQNCCNRGGNTIFKYMNYVSIFVATVWKCLFSSKEGGVPVLLSISWMYKSLVFGYEFLAQGLHLKSFLITFQCQVIILIYWFDIQETFHRIISAEFLWKRWYNFFFRILL